MSCNFLEFCCKQQQRKVTSTESITTATLWLRKPLASIISQALSGHLISVGQFKQQTAQWQVLSAEIRMFLIRELTSPSLAGQSTCDIRKKKHGGFHSESKTKTPNIQNMCFDKSRRLYRILVRFISHIILHSTYKMPRKLTKGSNEIRLNAA